MATEAAKNAIRAAMSFKDTPAVNCRSGKSGIKNLCNPHQKSTLKEYFEKIKEENADTKKED